MQTKSKTQKKSPLTYSIIPKYEEEIRQYIDSAKRETGVSKRHIVSTLLLDAIRRDKKNLNI